MQVEPHISNQKTLARRVGDCAAGLPRLPASGRFDPATCTARAGLTLPVQPQDQERVDEKYSPRGYNSIDARFGCDWNQQEE